MYLSIPVVNWPLKPLFPRDPLRRENEEMEGDIMISVLSLCFFRETLLELIGSDRSFCGPLL